MGKIRLLFLALSLGGLATVAAYFFAENSTSQLATILRPYTQNLTPVAQKVAPYVQFLEVSNKAIPEVSTLTQRSKEIGEHVGAVLGDSISEVETEKQPLHERALEYSQYLYCKGIVEEYEMAAN